MLLAEIEGFVTVAKHLNVSRAASDLCISQPALTGRLRNLERELGQRLFVRTTAGVRLTPAGQALLPHAKRILAAVDEGKQLMAWMSKGGTRTLTLAATPVVSTYVMPEAIVRFLEQEPDVRVSMRTGSSSEVLEMVRRDEVRIGLARDVARSGMNEQTLFEDDLVLVAPRDHPIVRQERVRIGDLDRERLILFGRSSTLYSISQRLFLGAGVVPNDVMEVDNAEVAKHMVIGGIGVALLPASAVSKEAARGELRIIDLMDVGSVASRIVGVTKADGGEDKAVSRLLAAVRDVAARIRRH